MKRLLAKSSGTRMMSYSHKNEAYSENDITLSENEPHSQNDITHSENDLITLRMILTLRVILSL